MKTKKIGFPQFSSALRADTHTFIIRIWQEGNQDGTDEPNWRGSIDHVGCDRHLYFIDGDGIVRFIEEQAGIRLRRTVPWWRIFLARLRNANR